MTAKGRLTLPDVTLCAATSINSDATLEALRASMDQIVFGDALFFSNSRPARLPDGVRFVEIPRIGSAPDYSRFVLGGLPGHIRSSHCLVVQWDGFVADAAQWDADFLSYDYIGAPWPQFDDGHDVGNGGFSLRSRRLMHACKSPSFLGSHPEDVAIGRVNRDWLERNHQIRFASREVAQRFAFERSTPPGQTFGFHGVFNMIEVLGPDRFWSLYETLSDKSTVWTDYALLMRQLGEGPGSARRRLRLSADRIRDLGRRARPPQA